jgi:hypothetical protein
MIIFHNSCNDLIVANSSIWKYLLRVSTNQITQEDARQCRKETDGRITDNGYKLIDINTGNKRKIYHPDTVPK